MLQAEISADIILKQISDAASPAAKGFLARVFVIEVDRQSTPSRVKALPLQCWGEYRPADEKGKKEIFIQDADRAAAAPFVLPMGGNPTKPQGRYAVPAYLAYDGQIKEFIKSSKAAEKFLAARTPKTIGVNLTEEETAAAAAELFNAAQQLAGVKEKLLALVVIAVLDEQSPYRLSEKIPQGSGSTAYLGPSVVTPGKHIAADLKLILERFWQAKLAEGAEKGQLSGSDAQCYFCGSRGDVVSTYCKAWPWFTTTWNCPLPVNLKDSRLVETLAVCPQCYFALTYGANIFNKLTKPLAYWLTKEIFSPAATAGGKKAAKMGSPDEIFGCAYALPVLDSFLEDEEDREEFADGMLKMLNERETAGGKLGIHLQEITGFEAILPDDIAGDNYRLTLIYYSGNISRGDVHLRATVEDVVPSVVKQLKEITKQTGCCAVETLTYANPHATDKQKNYFSRCYSSLPYLLTNAYGAPYIWQTLSTVLHRGRISRQRFLFNISKRMAELARSLPNTAELKEQAVFYVSFNQFFKLYCERILKIDKGGLLMRDWRELKEMLAQSDADKITINDAEELGFAAGYIIRNFSKQYWHASGGKDFLKHRVMTFGSSLTPEIIWKRALSRIDEYSRRLDMRITDNLRKKTAVVLMAYSGMKEQVNKEKDAFMAAFWSGYALTD